MFREVLVRSAGEHFCIFFRSDGCQQYINYGRIMITNANANNAESVRLFFLGFCAQFSVTVFIIP